ncbi:MAG: hypothetical protein SOT81_10740 [Treponema sp.]|nr:hypothetical protein [Treponema sp.]
MKKLIKVTSMIVAIMLGILSFNGCSQDFEDNSPSEATATENSEDDSRCCFSGRGQGGRPHSSLSR